MGLFDDINVDETAEVVEQTVNKKSTWIKESGAFVVAVTMFRFKQSDGGANGYVMEMETEDGAKIVQEDWFSSKKGDTTYAVKDRKTKMPTGERADLPGMAKLKGISRAITGNPLAFMKTEQKIVPIYNYEKQDDIDTTVDVATEFMGKAIMVLNERTLEDKTKKNPTTGDYDPIAEVKALNEILGWVDPLSHKTFSENAAGKDAATYDKFIERIEANPINDKRVLSVGVAEGAKSEPVKSEGSEEAQNAFS